MKIICCFVAFAVCVAVSTASHEESDGISRQTFMQWHNIFTKSGPQKWTEEHLVKLTKMCEIVTSSEPQPWDDERYQERQNLDLFKFDTEGNFRQHLQDARKCCKKSSVFDKKVCFKAMREDFLDNYCDQGANHQCCRNDMAQRFNCFGKKMGVTQEDLVEDDVRPLPSGIKLRRGPQLPPDAPEDDSVDTNREEDENSITELLEQLDDEVDTDGQCMADFFPENEVNTMTKSVANEVCADDTEDEGTDKKRKEAKACCRIGAFVGKKYVKKGCPYLQCRKIFSIFEKKHKQCIKHKRVCGFFFVSCCQRQHHKDFYLQNDQNEGQQEVEMFNEMPNQNRARKNGNTVREQPLRWE